MNYVHTSDESDDFLREIGILLDWNELLQAFEAMVSNHVESYPNAERSKFLKQDYTLNNWLDEIYNEISLDITSSDQAYIKQNIQTLKSGANNKITLEFLRVLCRNNLIKWNFQTLVVLSGNINYYKEKKNFTEVLSDNI